MNSEEKAAFLRAMKSDPALRDQVRALLREAPRIRARFIDENGVNDFGEEEEIGRAARAAERARIAALPPPPSTRRPASNPIDLTGHKWGSDV